MNYLIIEDYIKQYKDRFPEINQMEIYKWKAVKHFQDHWDIETDDFYGMLKESLSKTGNLLGSGKYLPRRTLKLVCKEDPEAVRLLFQKLFDESKEVESRVQEFRKEFILLKERTIDKPNHYQDDRAICVYLCLRFPKTYFFYKYEMFRDFSNLVDYSYKPPKGSIKNLEEFQQLCYLVRDQILEDNKLLNLHYKRLSNSDLYHQDPAQTILTQDFIYACVQHLKPSKSIITQEVEFLLEEADFEDYVVKDSDPNLNGSFVNFEKKQKTNNQLGKAGEHFILDREKEKLETLGVKRINKKVEHSSVIRGDGIGYDITSQDEDGNEIYIEVKATTGGFKTPFFITRSELHCSQQNPEKYRLYRLYDFDVKNKKGKVKVFKGDLTALCVQPVNYQIALTDKN